MNTTIYIAVAAMGSFFQGGLTGHTITENGLLPLGSEVQVRWRINDAGTHYGSTSIKTDWGYNSTPNHWLDNYFSEDPFELYAYGFGDGRQQWFQKSQHSPDWVVTTGPWGSANIEVDTIGWVEYLPGDANMDHQFNSSDFVQVFQEGRYETGRNAVFEWGDWDGDRQFTSSDLVYAFANNVYEGDDAPALGVPEPCGLILALFGFMAIISLWEKKS